MADLDLDLAIADIDPETGEIKATAYFEDYLHGISNPQLGDASYIKLSDVKSSGTSGGSSVVGNNIRTLNRKDFDAGNNCILNEDDQTFDLVAGTYKTNIYAPAFRSNGHKVKLYNITDAGIELTGKSAWAGVASNAVTDAILPDQFTITASKTFRIDHHIGTAKVNNGLGEATSSGDDEVYTVVELWKIS